MMMHEYRCKYCNCLFMLPQSVYKQSSNLVTLVDHIVIKHGDIIPQLGGIYLRDIPTKCFTLESGGAAIEHSNGTTIVGSIS